MGRTLKGLMDESCARWADLTAVRVLHPVGDSGKALEYRPISYRELDQQRRDLASALALLGLVKGQRVGILTDGGFEPLLVFLAADFIGLSAVPLCNKVSNAVLAHNIDHSGLEFLVVDSKSLPLYRRVEGDLGRRPRLLLVGGEGEGDDLAWDQVLALGAKKPPPAVEVEPGDESKIIYTSGSSGLPKGVIQTHANIVANLEEVWDLISRREPFRFFKSAPDFHAMGILNIYYPLVKGWVLDMARSPDKVLSDIRISEPEGFLTVPLVLDKVFANVRKEIAAGGAKGWLIGRAVAAKRNLSRGNAGIGDRLIYRLVGAKVVGQIRAQLARRVGSNLELLIVGSAKADPEALDFFQEVLGITTYEGYGVTECAPLIAANHLGGRKVGTVGRPLLKVRLVDGAGQEIGGGDPEEGTYRAGGGQVGELWASGANVMRGYLNDKEQTDKVLVRDEAGRIWYRTGDLFSMDDEGFLSFRGRVGRQFKLSNGEFVNPELLERVFARVSLLEHVMVWGDQAYNVPIVLATVDLEEAKRVCADLGVDDEATLRQHPQLAQRVRKLLLAEAQTAGLPAHERPNKVLLLPEALDEDNGTLTRGLRKIVPGAIVERYRAQIEAAYAE